MKNVFVKFFNLSVLCLGLWTMGSQMSGCLAAEDVFVPNFFDPSYRLAKPEMASIKLIRFLTEDDFPPFHFTTADGTLTGFDVEIARAICEELKLPCTIQPRRFEHDGGEYTHAMRHTHHVHAQYPLPVFYTVFPNQAA